MRCPQDRRSPRKYFPLAIRVFSSSLVREWFHGDVLGVFLLVVAVSPVAIEQALDGNALEDLPKERAQWWQATKDEDKPVLCTDPDYQGGNDVWDVRLALLMDPRGAKGGHM